MLFVVIHHTLGFQASSVLRGEGRENKKYALQLHKNKKKIIKLTNYVSRHGSAWNVSKIICRGWENV